MTGRPASRLLLGLGVLGLLAAPTHAADIRVRLRAELVGGASSDPRDSVVVHLAPQGSDAGLERSLPVSAPGELGVDLPEGVVWQVSTDHPRLWSAAQWLSPRPGMDPVVLRLFPAATISGVLRVPAGERLPRTLDVRLEASPAAPGPKPPLTPLQCPVENGRFECKVPAGRLDLRLRAPAFVPSYLWDVAVTAGEEKDLGTFALKAGSSVVGRVQGEDLKEIAGARVRLQPQSFGLPAERSRVEGLKAMAVEGTTNERGFFQLEVEPGMQVITVTRDGLAEISRAGIEVRPGLESQVQEPFVLTKPLTFRLTLDPAVSPSGTPWRIVLETRSEAEGLGGHLFRGNVGPEGRWEQGGLSPGRYLLSVSEGAEPRLAEAVELSAGNTDLHLSVGGVQIRGRIQLGDEPLRATLWFGGKSAPARARFESDEQGRFEGLLPKEGAWNVEVISGKEDLRLRLPPMEVRRLAGTGHATVDIRVPDTRLLGRVVDERGQPVARATVRIMPLARTLPSLAETDDEGEFELRGLPPGQLVVHAEEGERESEWLQAVLDEERDAPELRLMLQARITLHGRVFSDRGPVPGARITATADLGEAGAASSAEAVSGPAGELSLKVPAGTRHVHLTVLAPGHAIRLLRADVGPDTVLEIPLETVGGRLVLDLGSHGQKEVRALRSGVLAHNGTFVPLGTLFHWAELLRAPQPDPNRLVLPNMEAGEYVLCLAGAAQKAVSRGQEPSPVECSRGHLSPLQETTLSLPSIPERLLKEAGKAAAGDL